MDDLARALKHAKLLIEDRQDTDGVAISVLTLRTPGFRPRQGRRRQGGYARATLDRHAGTVETPG
jgi:hypothetical protein